jgi:CBS domain-containing protein
MYEFTHYQARDVMTQDPVTVSETTPLSEVERVFEAHDFNGLPVIDEERRLLGMVTKLDLLRAFAFGRDSKIPHYREIMARAVGRVMTRTPETVGPKSPLTHILQQLVDSRKKSLPVVSGDRLVGIIAREDILRALREASMGRMPERLNTSTNGSL